jgi:hypothetical protein
VRFAALAAAVAVAVGCGSTVTAPPPGPWRDNAARVLTQLHGDVTAAELGGTTPGAARSAIADTSTLYALLVAYTDLTACRQMLAGVDAPARVADVLVRPCGDLQRASGLFTEAMKDSDPAALAEATVLASRADPGLVRGLALVQPPGRPALH